MANISSFIENYANEKAEKFGSTIYHYCSINTLISILTNKELWFGCTASMNDYKEQRYFIEDLERNVKNELPHDKKYSCNDFFKWVYGALSYSYPYALCFSTLNDNAAQWERYADNACGVSIGFNTRQIVKIFDSSTISLLPVYYGFDTKNHEHFKTILEYILYKKLPQGFQNSNQLIDNILACAANHKHSSFSTEAECRLTTSWDVIPKQNAKFQFKFINNTQRKILVIDLNALCLKESIRFEDVIDSITIGPRSKQSKYELQEYLNEIGLPTLSTKIYKSNCPLR